MSGIKLTNLSKEFNNKSVLKNINLEIKEGELISLLGKSGCGKSTTLQLIAGLIQPDNGDILFNNKSVLNLPTDKRDAVIVFQDYLLFPHMSVFENIEFGLKMRKVDKKIRKEKVNELLKLVKLDELYNKYPNQLSGGQKQRVAIARSLAVSPKVLLLDEPFSNLDINLRNEMREFVLNLQKELKITTILVTHDKEEALMMSDRIGVMIDGEIKQYDTPKNLYEKPISKEVANIFGEPNYIKGKISKGIFKSDISDLSLLINDDIAIEDIENVEIMIPIESITIDKNIKDGIKGKVIKKRYAGGKTYYHIDIKGIVIKVISLEHNYKENEEVNLVINTKNIICFKL